MVFGILHIGDRIGNQTCQLFILREVILADRRREHQGRAQETLAHGVRFGEIGNRIGIAEINTGRYVLDDLLRNVRPQRITVVSCAFDRTVLRRIVG